MTTSEETSLSLLELGTFGSLTVQTSYANGIKTFIFIVNDITNGYMFKFQSITAGLPTNIPVTITIE